MGINVTNEKRFEEDIESFFLSPMGGYTKLSDTYNTDVGLYVDTFIGFIKKSQPKEWTRFENTCGSDPVKKFITAFNNACDADGLLNILRHGFKHRGILFRVCYFKPESHLNKTANVHYEENICSCVRQWHYSSQNNNSVDMVLVLNGIPVIALELKNQYTGQTVDNAKKQWMYDRDPREICFQFNKRILAYYCVDHTDVYMTTKLAKADTFFLPFNQGSNGAGNNGGAGNPPNPNGYPTAYLWENVLQKDSMLDILQKFLNLQTEEKQKKQADGTKKKVVVQKLIFPRYHQLDVVRKLIADVKENGVGKNYLIQHSAGSGKSNSIAWIAYRLAAVHDINDKPIFRSVIIVTDRTVLDRQLQNTISGFDHTIGSVETIGDDKTSKDLKNAINDGCRIIVTTLQKFPVIYEEVDDTKGRNFAVIVDEAHSSQTGQSATKLKAALADTEDALKEYAEIEGKSEEEIDKNDKLISEMLVHGRHKNLSFFAFTATPKDKTLEMFGTEYADGSFHPYHVYSMKQAIEEGFIMDVLQNYMTYQTCFKIAKTIPDNPEVPASRAAKVIRRFEDLHLYNISQKSQIIVETFRSTTAHAIGGRGKMMVVTSSRLAAVRYFHEIKRYIRQEEYDNIDILAAFSGVVNDGGNDYTESGLNVRKDGSHISETQTKEEFNENFNVLIVAEKYQTGFDEPLLHTMIVDKKLRGVKCVQTLSRLNRTCPGKTDTYILDFVNTAEDIQEAFQPFYQETSLSQEVNVDLIYQTQKELRGYNIYSDNDVKAFADIYFSSKKQDDKMMGRMTSALKPVSDRYNKLAADERYQFRRLIRSYIKWYGYITQICRMFDTDMQKEYTFCSYLLRLLPADPSVMIDLDGMLKLEFYKLEETFKGNIQLIDASGEYDPASAKGKGVPEKKEPLEEVIDKINEMFNGNFTDADRVVLTVLHDKLKADKKLLKIAKTSDPQIFAESIFPKTFDDVAQESYIEQTEAFSSMFQNKSKYKAMMAALAEILYKEFNK